MTNSHYCGTMNNHITKRGERMREEIRQLLDLADQVGSEADICKRDTKRFLNGESCEWFEESFWNLYYWCMEFLFWAQRKPLNATMH